MGGKQRTVKNVWVYKIDPARNLMWVKGQVIVFTSIYKTGTIGQKLSYITSDKNQVIKPKWLMSFLLPISGWSISFSSRIYRTSDDQCPFPLGMGRFRQNKSPWTLVYE